MAPQTGLEPVTPRLTRRRALRIVRFRDLQSFVLSKAHSLRRSSSPQKVVTFRGPQSFARGFCNHDVILITLLHISQSGYPNIM